MLLEVDWQSSQLNSFALFSVEDWEILILDCLVHAPTKKFEIEMKLKDFFFTDNMQNLKIDRM